MKTRRIRKVFLVTNGYIGIASIVFSFMIFFSFFVIQNKYSLISLGAEIGNSDNLILIFSLKDFLSINFISIVLITTFSILAPLLIHRKKRKCL